MINVRQLLAKSALFLLSSLKMNLLCLKSNVSLPLSYLGFIVLIDDVIECCQSILCEMHQTEQCKGKERNFTL